MIKPILLDIPMPIETPRLILRPLQPGDGRELNAAILESFDELAPWIPWADQRPTLEESEVSVREASAKWILREELRMMIIDKASGQIAGGTGFHRMNWTLPALEIGYWVRNRFTGRGFATEATHALTFFAFKQFGAKRVELRCDAENRRSTAVATRLGFELEGRLKKNFIRTSGAYGPRDTLMFARLGVEGLPDLEVRW